MATLGPRDTVIGDDGVAIWHARTTPELADAVRWLAGQVAALAPPASGYVPRTDFDALAAQVTTLQGQVADLTVRVEALENPPAP